ncbi:hypothetical protein V5O48_001988 [Marasmius crinis-equi]|uniref:HIT-type domain-containing protein n=1 Tax=Marasmius crinis-equi TaxID=585013 RepID=A0ABR3FX64_9AGAR
MPPSRSKIPCQVCKEKEMKYTCSACAVVYCSVPCYKQHKGTFQCGQQGFYCLNVTQESSCKPGEPIPDSQAPSTEIQVDVTPIQPNPLEEVGDELSEEHEPLKPLSSLRWPYVPEEPAYPDPLTRDDPKPLQLRHYESIATSEAIRNILKDNPNLPALLKSIDNLKGPEREDALQRALGVQAPSIGGDATKIEITEDVLALRAFAEAIEAAVRGERSGALGLDWGD